MSEVKRYHVTEAGLVEGSALGRINVVLGADYDSAVQCFLTAAEGCVAAERRERALQALLTAADERADALEGLLRLARQFVTNGVELGYITMPDPETPDAAHDLVPMIDAALKPAEGGGHDLKPANPRRILSDPHCSECGHPDCNGQCFGDDMMGD